MKPEFTIIKSLVLALCLSLAACASEEINDTNNSTTASTSDPATDPATDPTTDPTTAQCTDGIDNDSDGLTDLNDSGCSNAADNDESDDPIPPTQCADGIDNDSDSLTDLDDPGCANAADNDETDIPVSSAHDATRANSYDDAWEAAWIANVETILSTPVSGVTKTAGKVLQVGDSMTYTFAYGDWARHKTAATASDLDVINWMHAGAGDLTDGWYLSSNGITAMNNAGWGWGFVDNIFVDSTLNDAQFAVVMFNAAPIANVESRVNQFIDAGIVPVLSTIPPRTNLDFNRDFADPYNLELYALAERLSLPIIDFSKEILLRRPNGTWEKTLIGNASGTDGVHPSGKVEVTLPSGTVITYVASSDPYADGGDVLTHTTGEAALYSGQLLRTWLTVQKMKEIKQKAVDQITVHRPRSVQTDKSLSGCSYETRAQYLKPVDKPLNRRKLAEA